MRRVRVLCGLLILCSLVSKAQDNPELFFRSQGSDSDYKLLWAPTYWPVNLQGINVKRRAEGGSWELLNESPIIPATNSSSDLQFVTNSSSYLTLLEEKYDSLITNQKIPNLTPEGMHETFLSDTTDIKFLKFLASIQFDFALIHGIAYYDVDIPEASAYTYGLFTVDDDGNESEEPIEQITWEYGTTPEYTLTAETELKKFGRQTGLQAFWNIPTAPLDSFDIKGFSIYQIDSVGNRTKVSDSPVRVNMAPEITTLTYSDMELDNTVSWSFEAVPVDIFDTEGPALEASYAPEEFPVITSFGLLIEDDDFERPEVNLKWELDAKFNPYLSEFHVLRRQSVSEEQTELTTVNPESRTYQDEVAGSGYYFYQILVVTSQGDRYLTNEKMIYKKLAVRPNTPSGLRASIISERGSDYVFLRWDPLPASDTLTAGYQLYTDGIMGNGLAREGSIGLIELNRYRYEILPRYGKEYRFAVSAMSPDGVESGLSDTLSIFVPSKSLPQVNIWPIDKEDNVITLNWNYADNIDDLEGFRLYQNNTIIATEEDLTPETRQWVSPALEAGNYSYQLEAVTRFNVTSEKSKPRTFNIQEP